jgi:hypothetical protein
MMASEKHVKDHDKIIMKNILIFLLLLISNLSFSQTLKSLDFSISLGSIFSGDTISLEINKIKVIRNKITGLDSLTSLPDCGVYQNQKGLWILNGGRETLGEKIEITNNITLDVYYNTTRVTKVINLKKGKFVFVDIRLNKNNSGAELSFRQYKKL